jgi:hypothetical protein
MSYKSDQSQTNRDGPVGIVAITPSDSTALSKTIRGFMVYTAGNTQVTMLDGTTGIYPSCIPGVEYAGFITQVWVTNTVATGIVGLY